MLIDVIGVEADQVWAHKESKSRVLIISNGPDLLTGQNWVMYTYGPPGNLPHQIKHHQTISETAFLNQFEYSHNEADDVQPLPVEVAEIFDLLVKEWE